MMMDLLGLVGDASSDDDEQSLYDEYYESVRYRDDGLRRRPLYGSQGMVVSGKMMSNFVSNFQFHMHVPLALSRPVPVSNPGLASASAVHCMQRSFNIDIH